MVVSCICYVSVETKIFLRTAYQVLWQLKCFNSPLEPFDVGNFSPNSQFLFLSFLFFIFFLFLWFFFLFFVPLNVWHNSTLVICPGEMKMYIKRKICSCIFIANLFTSPKTGKNPDVFQQVINNLWYIHTIE